jgi:hypothetical protein
MADDNSVIGVLREHMQEIYAALDWARTQNRALDLAEAARTGRTNVQSSRITALIEKGYDHVEGYLDE